MKKLFVILFLLLLPIPAYADVAYEPPDTLFYEEHRKECTVTERHYYANGQEGYVTLYRAPQNEAVRYLSNGNKLFVYCTYKNWGMVTHVNGTDLETPRWTPLDSLYLIYDGVSFEQEFGKEFRYEKIAFVLPEGAEQFYVYQYPGDKNARPYAYFDQTVSDAVQYTYTDGQGRVWGYIRYYCGVKNEWVCISEPCNAVPPFGGDPNLRYFEEMALADETDPPEDTPLTPPDTEPGPVYPPTTPPAVVRNPVPVLAAVLVFVAVAAAVALLAVCYKHKK